MRRNLTIVALASALVAAACSGPAKKPVDPTPKDVESTRETCCCKHLEFGGDGYEFTGLTSLQCSQRSGECVDDVQCPEGAEPAPPPVAPAPSDDPVSDDAAPLD